MEIKYQFFEKENLLIQRFVGKFSFKRYLEYNRVIINKYDPTLVKKVLNDFRDLEIDEDSDDFFENVDKMTEIRKNINKNEIKIEDVTVVFWVDKPLPTVVAQLFVRYFRNKDYHYCSSTDKILKILNLTCEFNDLINITDNLENNF